MTTISSLKGNVFPLPISLSLSLSLFLFFSCSLLDDRNVVSVSFFLFCCFDIFCCCYFLLLLLLWGGLFFFGRGLLSFFLGVLPSPTMPRKKEKKIKKKRKESFETASSAAANQNATKKNGKKRHRLLFESLTFRLKKIKRQRRLALTRVPLFSFIFFFGTGMGPFYRVFLPSFGSSIKETCGLIDGHFDQLVPSFTGFHFSRNEGDRFGWFSMVFFLPTWALPSFTELLSKWIGFFRWWDRPYRVLPSFHRDRIQFLLCVSGIYPVLPSFTKFDRVVLGFTWFYRVLPSFTGFYWVLLGFT